MSRTRPTYSTVPCPRSPAQRGPARVHPAHQLVSHSSRTPSSWSPASARLRSTRGSLRRRARNGSRRVRHGSATSSARHARARRHEHVPHARAARARPVRARPGRGAAPPRRRRGRAVRLPARAARGTPPPRASCAAATAAQRFDVVHAHFGLTAWPALLARLGPVVVTLHGNDLFHPRSNRITRAALPFTALPAAVSREFSENVPGAGTTRRVAVLPVGIDLEPLPPDPARARRARASGWTRRGPTCCSRTTRRGRSSASTARARRPATCALLTMGGVAPDEVPYWINAANAVLVPSQAEGFGLAVIEATACGVPVLATPVGIHPVALEGVAGALCAPWDREAWRAALAPHLADPDPRWTPGPAPSSSPPTAWRGGSTPSGARWRPEGRDGAGRRYPGVERASSALLRRLRPGRDTPTAADPAAGEAHASDAVALETAGAPPPAPAGTAPEELIGDRPDTRRRGRLRRRLRHLRQVRELSCATSGACCTRSTARAWTPPPAATAWSSSRRSSSALPPSTPSASSSRRCSATAARTPSCASPASGGRAPPAASTSPATRASARAAAPGSTAMGRRSPRPARPRPGETEPPAGTGASAGAEAPAEPRTEVRS